MTTLRQRKLIAATNKAINQALETLIPVPHSILPDPCLVEQYEGRTFKLNGRQERLYRIVYMLGTGKALEKGQQVFKRCDTLHCCQIEHLYTL
jgi:hypothetical protein